MGWPQRQSLSRFCRGSQQHHTHLRKPNNLSQRKCPSRDPESTPNRIGHMHQPKEMPQTYLPIRVRVIHRDLVSSFDSFRHQHNSLGAHPHETLILAVRLARVVDKACVVALPSLPNLVRIRPSLSNHDIEARQARRDLADEFAHCSPAIEWQASNEAVVTSVWCAVDLYRGNVRTRLGVQVWKTIAVVLRRVV